MTQIPRQQEIRSFDDRRDIVIPGSTEKTLTYCVEHFISIGNEAIATHGMFCVALSGGSTPKTIFQGLSSATNQSRLDWKRVLLFWSDERSVPPNDPESNYKMAMDAGFNKIPIPKQNIFRMPADSDDLPEAAKAYEKLIIEHVPEKTFDLVMLGMGEDGHTASLFPKTHALHTDEAERLVVANFVPQKNTWRMSLTFNCINAARHIAIYVLGKGKAGMLKHVLTSPYDPDTLPIQHIGTRQHKALWIVDDEAAQDLLKQERR